MEFSEVVAARRMTRSFSSTPIPRSDLRDLLALARNAASAGFAQGAEFLVLDTPAAVGGFWDITLPAGRRQAFHWPGLLRAPVIVLALSDPRRYLERYSEPDKASSPDLGRSTAGWPAPYWVVDSAFTIQNLLLAATDYGLGSLFFGLFSGEGELRTHLGVPAAAVITGAVALGWPAPDRPSRSVARGWRPLDDVLHWQSWGAREL